jgi:hypothetical protein
MGRETKNPKYEFAFLLYMSGETRENISLRVGVAPKTITEWSAKNHWKERKSAAQISRPELVNKCLSLINKMLDKAIEGQDDNGKAFFDELIKAANTIEKLDRKNNVVNDIETFMGFNQFLQLKSQNDKQLTPSVLKFINQYQDLFITDRISNR